MPSPGRAALPWNASRARRAARPASRSSSSPPDHAGELFLSTVTGDSRIARLTDAGALPATYASAGAGGLAELLTVETDGTALMSVHFFDGVAAAVTHFGTCEELR